VCSRHPEVLWAQRSDKVYLTVSLPDAKDVSVKCEPHGLFTFSASRDQHESYNFSLELYGSIAPEVSDCICDRICLHFSAISRFVYRVFVESFTLPIAVRNIRV
jgi:hypothetical protein